MKMVRRYWKEISLITGLIFLYRDSFASRFFQDDRILMEIAKTRGLFEPIANFPYRPIAIQFFYSLGEIFGNNPLPYHIVLFLAFVLGLFFLQKLMKDWFITIFIAFNISLFPLFFWVATSYFSLAFFFVFASLYFYFTNKTVLAYALFIFGLLSNEIVLVFPALLALLSWLKNTFLFKKISIFVLTSLVYLSLRVFYIPFPTEEAYAMQADKFLATARWYLIRSFNLPEGIRGAEYAIYFLYAVLILLILLHLRKIKLKILFFSATWFFVGALPFYFLPNHMSAYYLTLSLFGPGVFISNVLERKYKYVFMICYIALSFLGLEYLKSTHWIILKNTGPIGSF